jgi:hypothetical protein
MEKLKSFSKKNIGIILYIILIVFVLYVNTINFGVATGYFKSDIEIFQTNIDVYSIYVAGFFVLISFLFLIFKNRNETKSENPNIISPEYLKQTPLIIFIAIIIYANFAEITKDCSLIINKQKQMRTAERTFPINSYNERLGVLIKTGEKEIDLGVMTDEIEFYKMEKAIYNNLEDKKNIKLKFKIGLLGLPFDPEYTK